MDDTPVRTGEDGFAHPDQALSIKAFSSGEEIIREGEDCGCFFVILSGQVRIMQRGKKVRLLGPQDVFGLESVLLRRPSPCSARTLGKARIAAYGPDSLDHFIRENPRMIQSILVSTLMQLLQTTHNLSQEVDAFAIEDVRVNFYGDGQVILDEGSTGSEFYRLVSSQGGLRVSLKGKEISRIEKPGEFFGELAALLRLPRQATVTSIGESAVQMYDSDDLDVIINDYPEIALQIMRTLAARLVQMNIKLTGTRI
jgi:CRP-like cAMP-binding protein